MVEVDLTRFGSHISIRYTMDDNARSHEITGILGVGGILVLELGSSLARRDRGGSGQAERTLANAGCSLWLCRAFAFCLGPWSRVRALEFG